MIKIHVETPVYYLKSPHKVSWAKKTRYITKSRDNTLHDFLYHFKSFLAL